MKKFLPNLTYLLLGLPLGLLYFAILITGFILGAGLLITLAGLPILVSMIFVTFTLADLDRTITSKLLGLQIAKPEAIASKDNSTRAILTTQLKSLDFWKELAYLIFKLPLGIFSSAIVLALVITSLAMISAPLIVTLFPGTDFMTFGNSRVDTTGEAMLAFMGGIVSGLLTILVINQLANVLGKFTVWTLGKKG